MFELEGLDHVALAVRDVERSADWYVEVLGFERRYQGMWNGVPVFVARERLRLRCFLAETITRFRRGLVSRTACSISLCGPTARILSQRSAT